MIKVAITQAAVIQETNGWIHPNLGFQCHRLAQSILLKSDKYIRSWPRNFRRSYRAVSARPTPPAPTPSEQLPPDLIHRSETWDPPQFWKKTLSEWKGHSRSNSRNSGAFSEQFSEWHSRPNSCENLFSEQLPERLSELVGRQNFSPNSRSVFFQNWGGSRAPEQRRKSVHYHHQKKIF